MSNHIISETDGPIYRLVFNRTDKRNALTSDMYAALADGFEAAASDSGCRAIVIEGSEGTFTAGNDLKDFLENPDLDESMPVIRFLMGLVTCDLPVIAAVDGDAVGVGTTMLLHCDIVVATKRARLQMPFVNLGLSPEAGASLLLPQFLGRSGASDLLMTGEPFDGVRAYELGIVNRLVEPDQLSAEAMAVARVIADKPPMAMRKTKALLVGDRGPLLERIKQELKLFSELLNSAECKETMSAFLEKRKPDYSKIA